MNPGWQTVPMSAVMTEFYDGPHATPPPADDGPIYLGIKNMTEDGHLDLSEIRHIAEKDYPEWTRRVEPRAGDVVFTYEASLHRYAIIPAGFRGTLGRRVALLRADPRVINTRFLVYAFMSPLWRRTVEERLNIGSTVDRLPLIDFPNFPITIPSLEVQRKIAAVLSPYDDLIENNTRRIKVLEEMAQRIYREWFVDFRYPGHQADEPLVETQLGAAPASWEQWNLADLVTTQYGFTASASTAPVGPKFLRGMDINKASYIDWSTVPFCSVSADEHERYRLGPDDVVVVRMADPGKVGIVETAIDAIFASYLIRLAPAAQQLQPYFLFYLLISQQYQQFARGASSGTTRQSLSAPGITNVQIALPPLDVQVSFDRFVRPMRKAMARLLEANAVLRHTRDLFLPRLISGEIDVENLAIAVEDAAA